MTRNVFLLAACVAALTACEARNPKPALQEPAAPDTAIEESALPEIEAPVRYEDGLELFDSESGLSVLDVGPQDAVSGLQPPKFAVHCDAAAKTLEAVAPARQLGPYAVAGPAQLVASGTVFEGAAVLTETEDGAAVSLTVPLSPELLAAVATTLTVRLVIGDGYAESHLDQNGTFPGFAGQCSLKSGVPLPVR
jgi:hypothetical protein